MSTTRDYPVPPQHPRRTHDHHVHVTWGEPAYQPAHAPDTSSYKMETIREGWPTPAPASSVRGYRVETINDDWPAPKSKPVKPRRKKSWLDNPWVQACLILLAIVEALIVVVLVAVMVWG